MLERSVKTERYSVEITMYDARIRKTEVPHRLQPLELNISVTRVLTMSAVKMIIGLAGTGVLIYAVSLFPGLWFLALPGLIALAGKVYDEAKLVQYLRFGEPIGTDHWEDTENNTEMLRIRAFENRSFSLGNR